MRKIAIIGAGQAGLLLGIGLVERGYQVTLVSDRTPEEILDGPVPAGAMVFHDALEVERELGLAQWDDVAVPARAVHIDVAAPGGQIALSIEAPLEHPGLCIDQRLKTERWIDVFIRRGGHFEVKPVTVRDLDSYTRNHELVVVATGKGELGRLFPKDATRSPFSAPQRVVSMVITRGIPEWDNFRTPGIKFRILPGIGEVFSAPIYMKDHHQGTFFGIEAIPGGPMDRVVSGMSHAAQLVISKEIFREFIPWDYAAIKDAVPSDERANLCGAILPIVRRPVGVLPSGAVVMAIADTANLQDPIAAQGANNAAKMARLVRERIVQRGAEPFDAEWMESVFEEGWSYLQHGNLLGQKLLLPPEPHTLDILGAASQNPAVAARFINGFNHPPALFPWYADPAEAYRFLGALA